MSTRIQFPQEITPDRGLELWRLNKYQTLWVHNRLTCAGESCAIHTPSLHHMRGWAMYWRSDRGFMERLCPDNQIGHPDPDQVSYWKATRPQETEVLSVHGCDGCCRSDSPAHREGPDGDPGAGDIQQ